MRLIKRANDNPGNAEALVDRTERFYKIDAMLAHGRFATFEQMMEALEVSRATLKRDLDYMRSRLNAPIVWDRDVKAYRFETQTKSVGNAYALPGLWFSATEIHALLTMQHLLSCVEADGLLGPHVKPLMSRLEGMLGEADNSQREIRKRVKLLGIAQRPMNIPQFQQVGSALLHRKRIRILYHARSTGESFWREVSPQRMVYYRDNWYLDAWCHTRNDLRNFSLDRVVQCEIVTKKATDIAQKHLDEVLGAGYGIFAGKSTQTAILHFSASRARWVSVERWHPQQKSQRLQDGGFRLEFPYSDDRELLMDILKYGADVEVLAPASLKKRVREEIRRMEAIYG